jgi:hypothetical protein
MLRKLILVISSSLLFSIPMIHSLVAIVIHITYFLAVYRHRVFKRIHRVIFGMEVFVAGYIE